jgi:hypothetical protein
MYQAIPSVIARVAKGVMTHPRTMYPTCCQLRAVPRYRFVLIEALITAYAVETGTNPRRRPEPY